MAAGSAGRSRISHGRFTVYALSLFFFSSRRRHTRSLCDWSSDVCSSDLEWLHFIFNPEGCKMVAGGRFRGTRENDYRIAAEMTRIPEGMPDPSLGHTRWHRSRRDRKSVV